MDDRSRHYLSHLATAYILAPNDSPEEDALRAVYVDACNRLDVKLAEHLDSAHEEVEQAVRLRSGGAEPETRLQRLASEIRAARKDAEFWASCSMLSNPGALRMSHAAIRLFEAEAHVTQADVDEKENPA